MLQGAALERYSRILVTLECGNEKEVESWDMVPFDAAEADPCRGARSPVRGHVPLRNVGVGSQGVLLPTWGNRSRKGTLHEQGLWQ